MNSLPHEYYIAYMFALLFSFYLGFTIIMKFLANYPVKTRIKYSITAGLLATKFIVFIATLLGIDHMFFILRIGVLRIPVTANLVLFVSNLLAVLSLNWERLKPLFTISEEEYERVFGEI